MHVTHHAYRSRRTPPANLRTEDRDLFACEFEKDIEASHVLVIDNALILRDVILAPWQLKIYLGYSRVEKLTLRDVAARLALLVGTDIDFIEYGIWIIDNWSHNYFHWLTDAIPRLLSARLVAPGASVMLPPRYRSISYVREALEILGVEADYFDDSKRVSVGRLCLPNHTAVTGNFNHRFINEVRDQLRSSNPAGGRHRKVYVSRKKARARKIVNEHEVQEVLDGHGFEIHYFEDYSLAAQIELMGETRTLVGLHGAGLTNMLFMAPGGSVLEIRNPGDTHNNCYFTLASDLGHRYFYQLGTGGGGDTANVELAVDPEELAGNLSRLGP